MRRGRAAPLRTVLDMPPIGRLLKAVAAAFAYFLYVWYAAVRATPGVKRRKAERRKVR